MAAQAAAKAGAAATKAAQRYVNDAVAAKAKVEAALNAAKHDEELAPRKRQLAELKLKHAGTKVKVAKALPLVAGLVQELPESAPKIAPHQAKLESFFQPRSV